MTTAPLTAANAAPHMRNYWPTSKSGMFDAIVAWHPDRLHRSPRELEDFIDLVEASGVAVATVQAGEYDLNTASGRMTARVVGAVARAESEQKSERIKRQREQAAARGEYHGGRRAYGYAPDGVTIVPEEAALIREAVDRVLAGESIRSITIDWNRRQIPSSSGKPWQTPSFRGTVTGPKIAGRRTFRGEDTGPAVWPPIISHEDHLTRHRNCRQPSHHHTRTTPSASPHRHAPLRTLRNQAHQQHQHDPRTALHLQPPTRPNRLRTDRRRRAQHRNPHHRSSAHPTRLPPPSPARSQPEPPPTITTP